MRNTLFRLLLIYYNQPNCSDFRAQFQMIVYFMIVLTFKYTSIFYIYNFTSCDIYTMFVLKAYILIIILTRIVIVLGNEFYFYEVYNYDIYIFFWYDHNLYEYNKTVEIENNYPKHLVKKNNNY